MLGQSFTLAGLAAVTRRRAGRTLEHARCGRSSAASCSTLEADPRSPGARPVRVRPGAHPRGRLRHARAKTDRKRATSRPRGSSRASATTSWPAPSPATTSPRMRCAPTVPRRTRSPPGSHRARAARPTGGRARRASTRRSTFLEQALGVTTDPAERADLHERAVVSASPGLDVAVVVRHAEAAVATTDDG